MNIEEIVARITNNIRFFLKNTTDLELGNLKLDMKSMKVTLNKEQVDLTLLEMRMLSHLLRAHPHTMTRTELIKRIWGNDTVKPGTINTHLTNLRPKIELWDHAIKVRDENILFVKKEPS
jgi:two-component system OmpR family response regulator